MAAGGLPRSCQFNRRQWNRSKATARTNEAARCKRSGFRPEQKSRLRIGNSVFYRSGKSSRPAGISRPSGRPHFWDRADERLECARCSNMGIPAARSISGEKLLHQHFAVGGNAGSARSVSKTVSGPRSSAHVVFETRKRFHFRHPAVGALADLKDENATNKYAQLINNYLLEYRIYIASLHH